MNESGNTWPPNQRDPRPFQPPQPLHHDPRDRDPRLTDPQGAADSPWRRTQRRSRPEATEWHPEPVSYGTGPGGAEHYPREPERYGQPDDEEGYDDRYDTGDRFVPGFGDYGDDEDDEDGQPGRAARRPSARSRGPQGPRRPRRRRLRWIAPLAALLVILIPLAIGGAYVYHLYQSEYHPADYSGPGTGYLVVQVPSGSSPTSLGP